MASEEAVEFFKENGYLIVRDLLSKEEVQQLQQWTQEVHDWIPSENSDFMPYEVCRYVLFYAAEFHKLIN
jgi:hypothetical protein